MHGRRSFPFFGGRITPTRKVIRKATSVKDLRILSEKVVLERVFGLTTLNSNGLACNPVTGILAYPAGCVIVLLDPYTNTQSHIFNPEKKTLTALAFSSDGRYLASGECGHNPCVRIWELGDTPIILAELKGHKYAINCVAFSPNLKYLASIGDQHDMNVNIWNWRTGSKAACNKIGSKVRSACFSENGSYLVTVGNRHVKYWYFDTEASSKLKIPTPLHGRSGILGDQKDNYFCDVACGVGENAANTYCITKSGKLCAFSPKRLLDRWVELRCNGANCLAANEDNIFCGCSNGVIRVFHPKSLKFVCTLPRPHSLGVDIAQGLDASHMVPKNLSERYPDVLAMVLDANGKKLTCIYNDHSMYIWDVGDIKKVGKSASYLYHSGCIWSVESYPVLFKDQNPRLPPGSFITCSSDDTVRVWNVEDGSPSNRTFPRNIYSKELLKIVYCDDDLTNIQDMSGCIPGAESKTGIRCIKVSPDGQLLAAGDRSGNLRVYDLQFVDELIKIAAHDSEILCVEFSSPESGHRLLVTSSRDRLIHIFDINQDFALFQTIDDHSSSITAVRFNYDNDTFQLLSCGADKNIMFHNAQLNNNGVLHFVRNTIVVGKATMYDMDVEPTRKYAATVGVDRNVRVYDIHGAKQTHCYKGSLSDDGTVIKIHLDPSGLYAATSCSDKSVCVYEFESGDCNAVMYGHSELVLGLQFTVDGRRLISVSGDGCIFIWKLPGSFKQAIISRLQELQKPLPYNCITDTDPLSSIRRTTFFVPPKSIHELKETNEQQDSFVEGSSSLFDESAAEGDEPAIDYRFSVGRLPAWAKKQIVGDDDASNSGNLVHKEHQAPVLPAGRWGQRIGNNNARIPAKLEQPSFTNSSTRDSLDDSLALDDFESTGMESQFLQKAKSVPNLSIAHEDIDCREQLLRAEPANNLSSVCSAPYSSHKRERNKKDETFILRTMSQLSDDDLNQPHLQNNQVIYPPTNQEDYDAEVASTFEVTANSSLRRSPLLSEAPVPLQTKPGISSNQHPSTKEAVQNGIEEDGEVSDVDASSDGETAASDNEESPLKHHFECLASDGEILDEKDDDDAPKTTEEAKIANELISYRASISAKFLSRSQQTRPGKQGVSDDEQKRLLETLNKAMQNKKEPPEKEYHEEKTRSEIQNGMSHDSGAMVHLQDDGDMATEKGSYIGNNLLNNVQGVSQNMSPAEPSKTTSDLIALFNQRSSTPTHPKERKQKSRAQPPTATILTPALSPVGSPKRRIGNSPDKIVKFDLSLKDKSYSGIYTTGKPSQDTKVPLREHKGMTLRTRRSARPTPNKGARPKSLMLPESIFIDAKESSLIDKALSDTEIDDHGDKDGTLNKRNKRKLTKNAAVAKSASKTFVAHCPESCIQREIDIDEEIAVNTNVSKGINITAPKREVELGTHILHENRRQSSHSLDLRLSCSTPDAFDDSKDPFYFEHSKPQAYYNSSPPERDINFDSLKETVSTPNGLEGSGEQEQTVNCTSIDDEIASSLPYQEECESMNDVEEMEVSVERCGAVISNVMNSFKQLSLFQTSVLALPSSHLQQEVLSMLTASYNAIEKHITSYRQQSKGVTLKETESILISEDFNNVLKSIEELYSDNIYTLKDKVPHGDNSGSQEPVLNLLQTYSQTLLSLIARRLERETELDTN